MVGQLAISFCSFENVIENESLVYTNIEKRNIQRVPKYKNNDIGMQSITV